MIGRHRGSEPAPDSDLSSRARAAVRDVAEGSPNVSGGLTGFFARALRLRRPAPTRAPEPGVEAADAKQLEALREELTRELGRVAREHAPDGEEAAPAEVIAASDPGRPTSAT